MQFARTEANPGASWWINEQPNAFNWFFRFFAVCGGTNPTMKN